MDLLCLVTFRSFVVQWSAKIVSGWPQLKPLVGGGDIGSKPIPPTWGTLIEK